MPHITLIPFTACCQYNNTLIQQNNSGSLLLSHRICDSYTIQYSLTFTLTTPPIDFSFCELDSVILELPIQRFYFYNYPLCNRVIISSNSTVPNAKLEIVISPSSFHNGFLHLDITSLLNKWNPNQAALYKMTISLENPGLSMRIRNQCAVIPRIYVEYHTISQNRFAPDSTKHSYLEVCSVSSNNCFIDANGVFLFESIDSASDISYSTDTGLFSFSSSGVYYVDWMLYIRGTGSVNWIRIGIQNQTTGVTFPFNSPCVIPGQICGQHILHVEDTSYQYSLINSSEATIQLCSNNTNASLIIFKL